MTVKEARELLTDAKTRWSHEIIQSKVNLSLTTLEAVNIVINGIANDPEDKILSHLYEKRVHQVYRNQKRPRFN